MSHRAQQIVDAMATALAASTTLAARVYTHRRVSLSAEEQDVPAVSVDYGADDPLGEFGVTNLNFIDSRLEVLVRVLVKGADEQTVLTELLDRRVAVHKALIADRSQGLGFVIDTQYAGAAAPDVDVSTDQPAGSLTCRWVVHYRMNLADPS